VSNPSAAAHARDVSERAKTNIPASADAEIAAKKRAAWVAKLNAAPELSTRSNCKKWPRIGWLPLDKRVETNDLLTKSTPNAVKATKTRVFTAWI
jgi:hypothetical protein